MEDDSSTEIVTVGLHPQLRATWAFLMTPEKQLDEIELEEFAAFAFAIPGGFEKANF